MKKTNLRPIAFVLSSTNHGSLLVNRHDYHSLDNSPATSWGVGHQLLSTSSFDQEEVDCVLNLLESRKLNYGDGVIALDCGANIGVHTVEWAKLMSEWGEVIAFEAQERIFYALAGNITLNNCFNARAIWAAVGSSTGHIGVPIPNYFKPSSFGSLEIRSTSNTEFIGQIIDYTNLQQTQMISIDDMELVRLDFIKIDIEGMEMEALNGAKETIIRTRPQILVERVKSNEEDISNFLVKHGYKIFPMGLNFLAIHESDPISSQIQIT